MISAQVAAFSRHRVASATAVISLLYGRAHDRSLSKAFSCAEVASIYLKQHYNTLSCLRGISLRKKADQAEKHRPIVFTPLQDLRRVDTYIDCQKV